MVTPIIKVYSKHMWVSMQLTSTSETQQDRMHVTGEYMQRMAIRFHMQDHFVTIEK